MNQSSPPGRLSTARDSGPLPPTRPAQAGAQARMACRIRRGVRIHPVPRLHMCLVQAPDGGTFTLDRTAWRLLELCALEDLPRVRSTFVRAHGGGRAWALSHFETHLAQLVALGVVSLEEVPAEDGGPLC